MAETDAYQQAQELLNKGDARGATALLEELTRKDPLNWRAFSRLGLAYAQANRYEVAIGAFRRAVELNSRAPNVRYNLGQAYELAGVPLDARHEYEEALRLDPSYELARKALDRLRARMKAAQEAEEEEQ